MPDITRRSWLARSGLLPRAVASLTANDATGIQMMAGDKRLRVVVVGAHPDDPESSCGGTMSRYAELGHDVIAVYLTLALRARPLRRLQQFELPKLSARAKF
jgi:hypothetical protein